MWPEWIMGGLGSVTSNPGCCFFSSFIHINSFLNSNLTHCLIDAPIKAPSDEGAVNCRFRQLTEGEKQSNINTFSLPPSKIKDFCHLPHQREAGCGGSLKQTDKLEFDIVGKFTIYSCIAAVFGLNYRKSGRRLYYEFL